MADPILYSFRRCPYAMRARMALAISDIAVEAREVVLRDKPQAMLDISPKGTVPVLVLADGTVIDESIDVMRWALAQSDPENWLDGDDPGLIAANDGPFKHHLDRYKYSARHGTDAEEHRAACYAALETLDGRLSATGFLAGSSRTLPDIAIFPFIRQFANTDREWFDSLPLPGLQAWLKTMIESELFAGIMVKHPQWKPDGPSISA